MDYYNLFKWGQRIGVSFAILAVAFIGYEFGGKKITEEQALKICANVIYSNISKNFIIPK